MPYELGPEGTFYTRSDRVEFSYSDSDEAEERIWRIVDSARDRTTSSRELMAGITDWPSLYHLTPYRANVLRPFAPLVRGDVLEVGCGCGALTRFLGEQGASVTAVEGSSRRARIAAARCAGLPNVQIYCDNFQDFSTDKKFDLVTCIGVVEYAPLYFNGPNPFDRMLRRLVDCLAPGGCLLIAIENRLGLKYFAGAPEDHTNKRFQSIEDLYGPATPLTLGRREWADRLQRIGVQSVSFWYPFPDYKIPSLMVSSAAFGEDWLNLGSLLRPFQAPDRGVPYERTFSEGMVWPVLLKNGLAEDLANSFVILARPDTPAEPERQDAALLYHYSTDRMPEYAVEMSIPREGQGPRVRRRPLFGLESPSTPYRHQIVDEPYIAGEIYSSGLYRVLNTAGWEFRDVARWAGPWGQYLQAWAYSRTGGPALLPRKFLDCIPGNLILRPDGTLHAFDLEFLPEEPPSLLFVVFRGLWAALARVRTCAEPAGAVELGVTDAVFAIMDLLGFQVSSEERNLLIRQEGELQSAVQGLPLEEACFRIRLPRLQVRNERAGYGSGRAFTVQLFWKNSPDAAFREIDSCRRETPASPVRRVISLTIPAGLSADTLFRLDPADRSGLARLFGMRLLDAEGAALWTWDGEAATLSLADRRDIEFFPVPGAAEVIAYFSSDDPQLSLSFPELAMSSLSQGGALEVDLGWMATVLPNPPHCQP